MRDATRLTLAAILGLLLVLVTTRGALADDPATTPAATPGTAAEASPLRGKIVVLQLEALGMDAEPVARLETLFRMELERLAGEPLPTRRQIARAIRSSRTLRRCAGADRCLAKLGAKLGVDLVVTGNVAALGDSFILNIKAVDVATGKKLPKRISTKPLRGSPDELIEAVRVAAYELLAPAAIYGSINVLTDLVGAEVSIDGKVYGKTPLLRPIRKLPLGDHKLVVSAKDYISFEETVRVRFQKSTRVIVRLAKQDQPTAPVGPIAPIVKRRPATNHWYSSTLFLVGAGLTAAVLGGAIGYRLAVDPVIDCGTSPGQCAR